MLLFGLTRARKDLTPPAPFFIMLDCSATHAVLLLSFFSSRHDRLLSRSLALWLQGKQEVDRARHGIGTR